MSWKQLTKKDLQKPQNVLTISRIPLSILMIIAAFIDKWFFLTVVIVIGLTDFFDGMVARARKEANPLGAWLDSTCDHIFYPLLIACIYLLYPQVFNLYVIPIIFVLLWWLLNIIITQVRFGKVVFVHLQSVRVSASLLFFMGIFVILDLFAEIALLITLIVFAIRAAEETYVFLKMPKNKINPDLRYFWQL